MAFSRFAWFSAVLLCGCAFAAPQWPEVKTEMRPWAFNWWMGSAVTTNDLRVELEQFRDAGMGGIHIIPIYQAKGHEQESIEFLSDRWLALLNETIRMADRLGLGVDMTTGTGWCFGGPQIPADQGVMELRQYGDEKKLPRGSQVLYRGTDAKGNPVILASRYAAHVKVKRAAPGGAGPMLNPIYPPAMASHLEPFAAAFAKPGQLRPRSMYHDSFEYYGTGWSPDFLEQFKARRGYDLAQHFAELAGVGDSDAVARVKTDYRETASDLIVEAVFPQWAQWCKSLGMLTRNQAHGACANLLDFYALSEIPETEMFGRGNRDPLQSRFDDRIREGGRSILASKFASSAAHVAGRRLVSSETCTWMAEHFNGTLEEMKCEIDLFFLAGINHLFYHGTCYSPVDAPWPGWSFYASTQVNQRNPIWRDLPVLNAYITRCQSMFQSSRPDHDLLVYWPLHDLWHNPGGLAMQLPIEAQWLTRQPVGKTAQRLFDLGCQFDFVSDRLLASQDHLSRGYAAVWVPPCRHLPVATAKRLLALAESGMNVVFEDRIPDDVPGAFEVEQRRAELKQVFAGLRFEPQGDGKSAVCGKGRIFVGGFDAVFSQNAAKIRPVWQFGSKRVNTLRFRRGGDLVFFTVNGVTEPLDVLATLPGQGADSEVYLMDPMSGEVRLTAKGAAPFRFRLGPGHSVFLQLKNAAETVPGALALAPGALPKAPAAKVQPVRVDFTTPWRVEFLSGGPGIPAPRTMEKPGSWSLDGEREEPFCGTAAYSVKFDLPGWTGGALTLDLGEVCNSARVRLNGRELGGLIMHPYRLTVPESALRPRGNELTVEVTNLGANRIRHMDRNKMPWKTFHDINIVSIRYKPLDASGWPLKPSGLLGPVAFSVAEPE